MVFFTQRQPENINFHQNQMSHNNNHRMMEGIGNSFAGNFIAGVLIEEERMNPFLK
jgi:hypothetical protein